MSRIYLAGPINGCTDDEAKNWRDELVRMVPHVEFVDPMVRDYRGREDECVLEIVENDKADINSCHALVANCWQVSAGTSMEILYAAQRGMPVVIIVPPGAALVGGR